MKIPPPGKVQRANHSALGVFARAPVPGSAKTRLIPLMGEAGAAQFQSALLWDTLRKAQSLSSNLAIALFLAGRKSELGAAVNIPSEMAVYHQDGSTLGDRIESVFRKLFKHHQSVVIIGADSPLLPARVVRMAFRELRVCDAVLGPCPDGGYYLVGLRGSRPRAVPRGLLHDVRWSTRFAFRDTLGALTTRGLSCSILPAWPDVDRPADVVSLKRTLARHPAARRLAPQTWRFLKAFT